MAIEERESVVPAEGLVRRRNSLKSSGGVGWDGVGRMNHGKELVGAGNKRGKKQWQEYQVFLNKILGEGDCVIAGAATNRSEPDIELNARQLFIRHVFNCSSVM